MRLLHLTCVSLLLSLGLTLSSADAQTLYGGDALTGGLVEFTTVPGGPCPSPNGFGLACPPTSFCPPVPPPIPTAGTILGDVATDKLADLVYRTDGRVIHAYEGDNACGIPAPCTWVNADLAPTFMGGLTGMGMDSAGGTFTPLGTPVLWVTDGFLITGLIPSAPGSCTPFGVAVGPFFHGVAGIATLTDVSWDPTNGTLWCPDTAGAVTNILVGGGLGPGGSTVVVPGSCGLLTAPLTGLSLDTATPCAITGTAQAYYVTDGFFVDYLDITGAPAAPTFYTTVNCTPSPAFLEGLAHTGNGIDYGFNRITATVGTFGQSSSPGPSFGIEVSGAPLGANLWLVVNSNVPGPGYACPFVPGLGTRFWVNPVGWSPFFMGTVTAPCMAIPAALPPGLTPCFEIDIQFVATNSANTIALDATQGMSFTIQLP